jgi:methionyl aminopeptidase
VRPGATLGDVGHAIQSVAHREHFSVVREYCGHGIGQVYHEDLQVLHYGRRGEGLRLEQGMVFTIEPMLNAGQAARPGNCPTAGPSSPRTGPCPRSGSTWWR